MKTLAQEILREIRKKEEIFNICNDDVINDNLNNLIASGDWDSIKQKNISNIEKQSYHDKNEEFTDLFHEYINKMSFNKDITKLLPLNTRFRFIKRIIKKLMKVSTRYQEEYNSNNLSLVHLLCSKLVYLEEQLHSNLDSIKSDIYDSCKRLDSIESNIHDSCKRIDSIESNIHDSCKRLDSIESNIHDSCKRLDSIESNIHDSYKRLDSIESNIHDSCKRLDNNELWLKNESNRITGNEKWIESTNKRIDSCNEIISIDTEQGFSTYSQAGEDIIVSMIFSKLSGNINIKSYLDIGANHYKNYNNTFHFYKKGLSGVLIEANPMLIKDLQQYRNRDIIVNCGVGKQTETTLPFYVINGYGLSSFNKSFIDNTLKSDKYAKIKQIIDVPVLSINDIIEKYFNSVTPSFISIDIEGDELTVLSSMNFEKYRPVVFIIETIGYTPHLTLNQKRVDIIEFMEKNNYVEYAFTGVNSIFIDKTKI